MMVNSQPLFKKSQIVNMAAIPQALDQSLLGYYSSEDEPVELQNADNTGTTGTRDTQVHVGLTPPIPAEPHS